MSGPFTWLSLGPASLGFPPPPPPAPPPPGAGGSLSRLGRLPVLFISRDLLPPPGPLSRPERSRMSATRPPGFGPPCLWVSSASKLLLARFGMGGGCFAGPGCPSPEPLPFLLSGLSPVPPGFFSGVSELFLLSPEPLPPPPGRYLASSGWLSLYFSMALFLAISSLIAFSLRDCPSPVPSLRHQSPMALKGRLARLVTGLRAKPATPAAIPRAPLAALVALLIIRPAAPLFTKL